MKLSISLPGLDAVLMDLRNTIRRRKKSPSVVLRKKPQPQDKVDQEPDKNVDRSFIIDLVESSSKQYRTSIKMADNNELSLMFSKFNLNNSF